MGLYSFLAFFVYLILFVIGQQYILHRQNVMNTYRSEAPGYYILMLCSMILLVCWAMTVGDQPIRFLPMIIGSFVVLLGLALSMSAQAHLGRNWVGGIGLHRRHRLITSGPYRYVRHPLYSGMMVSAIGLGIFSWNILFLLMAVCFAGAFSIRTLGEEALLQRKFPRQYAAYAARTGRLIPRIRTRN